MDEGYIKFRCNWIKETALPTYKITEINTWRDRLYEYSLIGAYPNGIGFGNISVRTNDQSFIISGSATGTLETLNENHYVRVDEYNFAENSLTCTGPIEASSESLSHASIYACSPETNAVIHIHNMEMWKKFLHQIPTTRTQVLYGTPEMANEIKRLFEETDIASKQIMAMAGHEEGIIAFGKTLADAGKLLFDRL